jgi:chromosome segregation ATPase
MADADKILKVLEGLRGDIQSLQDGQKAIRGDIQSLQAGQTTLQTTVEHQGSQLTSLQLTVEKQGEAVKELQEGQKTLELKVEVFHTEQKQANQELIGIFHTIGEINTKALEKRVDRIEKHLDLPPLK